MLSIFPEELPNAVLEYLKGELHECLGPDCHNQTVNPKFCSAACREKYYYWEKKKNKQDKKQGK